MNRALLAQLPLPRFSRPAAAPAPVRHGQPKPAWVTQPTRTVDNGYIVYVGSAEDTGADRAQLKAESAAVEDLANECSLYPKARAPRSAISSTTTGLSHMGQNRARVRRLRAGQRRQRPRGDPQGREPAPDRAARAVPAARARSERATPAPQTRTKMARPSARRAKQPGSHV